MVNCNECNNNGQNRKGNDNRVTWLWLRITYSLMSLECWTDIFFLAYQTFFGYLKLKYIFGF